MKASKARPVLSFQSIRTSANSDDNGKVLQVFANRWWLINGNGEILFSRGQPVCNGQKEIADMRHGIYSQQSKVGLQVQFVEVALVDVTARVWND